MCSGVLWKQIRSIQSTLWLRYKQHFLWRITKLPCVNTHTKPNNTRPHRNSQTCKVGLLPSHAVAAGSKKVKERASMWHLWKIILPVTFNNNTTTAVSKIVPPPILHKYYTAYCEIWTFPDQSFLSFPDKNVQSTYFISTITFVCTFLSIFYVYYSSCFLFLYVSYLLYLLLCARSPGQILYMWRPTLK